MVVLLLFHMSDNTNSVYNLLQYISWPGAACVLSDRIISDVRRDIDFPSNPVIIKLSGYTSSTNRVIWQVSHIP